jgi:predicted ABC-type transport system involved in lysophospholipase L1 biosynthesis ATPase subunit
MVTHDPRAAERVKRTLRLADGVIACDPKERLHVA